MEITPRADAGTAENGEVLEAWNLRLDNLANPTQTRYNVRYQSPKVENKLHTVEIQVLRSGEWRRVNTTANGSYLSFPVQGDQVSFRAVEVSYLQPKVIVLAAAAGVSLLGLIVIAAAVGHRNRKERKFETSDGKEGR